MRNAQQTMFQVKRDDWLKVDGKVVSEAGADANAAHEVKLIGMTGQSRDRLSLNSLTSRRNQPSGGFSVALTGVIIAVTVWISLISRKVKESSDGLMASVN